MYCSHSSSHEWLNETQHTVDQQFQLNVIIFETLNMTISITIIPYHSCSTRPPIVIDTHALGSEINLIESDRQKRFEKD